MRLNHIIIILSFLGGNICVGDTVNQTARPTIKILAIDGGGIRGIIPLKILSALEEKLKGTSITNHFDIMGGTSAGGLIVLMLNIPNQDKSPKHTARSLYPIFKEFGQRVFKRSYWHQITTFNGWTGPKYDDEELNSILSKLMEKYTILDTVKDVIVPAYDLVDEKNYFFRKTKALESKDRVFYLKDIARATTAAPTYFNPAEIKDTYKVNPHIMVDGGVSVNNPALSALVYAYSQYGNNADYIVISIGTGSTLESRRSKLQYYKLNTKNAGKLGWASDIVPLLMDSVNDVTDYQMQEVLGRSNYYRLQVTIDPEHSNLDDASTKNIEALEKYAEKYIKDNQAILNQIAEKIKITAKPYNIAS